jgi:hypothetical protein
MSRHPTSLTKGLSLLRSLLEAATARVPGIVERHDGDTYDKSFKSWEHLVTLIYAQLSGTDSWGSQVAYSWHPIEHGTD